MFCWLRTIGVCAGVFAVCVLLASLSWQMVLFGFALSSLVWAVFSLSRQLRPRRREPQMVPPVTFEVQRRRQKTSAQLYAFPADMGNQTMAP